MVSEQWTTFTSASMSDEKSAATVSIHSEKKQMTLGSQDHSSPLATGLGISRLLTWGLALLCSGKKRHCWYSAPVLLAHQDV